jgi:hypothetical protein
MTYERTGARALDYDYCHYGRSRLAFRGPQRPIPDRFVLCLGGYETFGRFIETPNPALLERRIGRRVLNLGLPNTGWDAYLADPWVMDMVRRAEMTILQVPGLQCHSNRYYTVHPRRNDRVIGQTPLMREVFREVDFTEFNFTRHLVGALQARAPDRFNALVRDLRAVWLSRLKSLVSAATGGTAVMWFAPHPPMDKQEAMENNSDPWGVDKTLFAEAAALAKAALIVRISAKARALGAEGMVYSPIEAPATFGLPGPVAHQEAAEQLAVML